MYNRYIPADAGYTPVPAPEERAARQPSHGPRSGLGGILPGGLGNVLGGAKRGLGDGFEEIKENFGGLLKGFHVGELDTGDILLALIVLFLILEDGDNLDIIITLGLMILFSLGEKKDENEDA